MTSENEKHANFTMHAGCSLYHPGSQQVIADTLSRLSVEIREERDHHSKEVLNIATMEEEAQELSRIKEHDYVRIKDQRLFIEIQRAAATDPRTKHTEPGGVAHQNSRSSRKHSKSIGRFN